MNQLVAPLRRGVVSVCTPCYNVASYIHRLFDSLIAQTYKQLEIIVVDDGSTDDTTKVIDAYLPKLKYEGYMVSVIHQENKGQSYAINEAIKRVTGEYLFWPDSDDWLTPDSIEKRVRFLEEHKDAGGVRCNVKCIDESSGAVVTELKDNSRKEPWKLEGFVRSLIFCKTWFAPVSFFVRMECFLKANPRREIYCSKKSGQNWQMLIPVAASFDFWHLPESLGYYLVRKKSHSHHDKSLKASVDYIDLSRDTLLNTLRSMPELDAAYRCAVEEQFAWKLYAVAFDCRSKVYMRKAFTTLKHADMPWKRKLRLFLNCYFSTRYQVRPQ